MLLFLFSFNLDWVLTHDARTIVELDAMSRKWLFIPLPAKLEH